MSGHPGDELMDELSETFSTCSQVGGWWATLLGCSNTSIQPALVGNCSWDLGARAAATWVAPMLLTAFCWESPFGKVHGPF